MNQNEIKKIFEELKKESFPFLCNISEENENGIIQIEIDRNFKRIYSLMNQIHKSSLLQKKTEKGTYILDVFTSY